MVKDDFLFLEKKKFVPFQLLYDTNLVKLPCLCFYTWLLQEQLPFKESREGFKDTQIYHRYVLVWKEFEKDCSYDSFSLTVGVFEKRKASKFKISIREGPQKKFFGGKLSQIWVGGVSDSQTDPKRNLKSPFLTNFTLCVSNCHKKHLVGFKYAGQSFLHRA